jgi:DNA repair photolyase
MKIKEISCKSLLNKSKLADYCINPYIGCEHACVYCYADDVTRRFSRHEEPWGKFVDVKINAPEVLNKEMLTKKRGTVFISSITDPYQPLEKKYQLTRKCLEILLEHQFAITIQTKSSLVVRDISLLKEFKNCEVGFTVTTLDENVRKNFEPFSSSVKEKLEALRLLNESGIRTYVFFGPVLPHLSDKNLIEYLQTMSGLGIDCLYIDKLNLKPGVWESVQKVIEKNYPDALEEWKNILFTKNDYYTDLKQKIVKFCSENKMKCIVCY